MKSLFKNNRGATMVEFGLVALPVFLFIFGIMQTAYVVWTDNLLHVAVDGAARCGAVPTSTTPPCYGSGLTNMTKTANAFFFMTGASFTSNATCAADGGSGLVGTYTVNFLHVVNMTLTAKSCYPAV